ncbi:MAG: hypothetical protein JNJ41_12990 [Bacteroidia bacterium]|nr:hypothetical protein [Bacteroidia bacterium]
MAKDNKNTSQKTYTPGSEPTYLDQIADATDIVNYWFMKLMALTLLVSIIIFAFTGQDIYQGFTFFLDGLGITLSFVFIGGIIGFIFGIPKSLQNANPNGDSSAKFVTNTSLEQISDWLTKIIVGVGLIEIREVFSLIKKLYYFFCNNVSCNNHCHEWGIYLTSLAIISILLGFLAFYVYTRVNLSSMFFKKSYDESKFKDEVAKNMNSAE